VFCNVRISRHLTARSFGTCTDWTAKVLRMIRKTVAVEIVKGQGHVIAEFNKNSHTPNSSALLKRFHIHLLRTVKNNVKPKLNALQRVRYVLGRFRCGLTVNAPKCDRYKSTAQETSPNQTHLFPYLLPRIQKNPKFRKLGKCVDWSRAWDFNGRSSFQ
jgi:hypothetical protein